MKLRTGRNGHGKEKPSVHTWIAPMVSFIAGGASDRRFPGYYTMGIEDWISGRYRVIKP